MTVHFNYFKLAFTRLQVLHFGSSSVSLTDITAMSPPVQRTRHNGQLSLI